MTPLPQWRTLRREWLVGLMAFSLLIAPFGCQSFNFTDPADDVPAKQRSGTFLNQDAGPTLMGGRTDAGDTYFIYGTRTAGGQLQEVQSIGITTAAGEESFIAFESGRPVHVQGPNGSYAHLTYTEVSLARLKGNVEVYNAGDQQKQFHPFEIDLQQSLQQIAAQVQAATGRPLRTVKEVDTQKPLVKPGTAQVLFLLGLPFIAVAMYSAIVTVVTVMTVILGQLLVAVFTLVAAVLQVALMAVFTPFFLIGALLTDTSVHIEYDPLPLFFDFVPDPPVVVLI